MDTITPRGPFSLAAAAEFGFGPTEGRAPPFDGVMRLAFPVDGGAGYAAATLRQPEPDGPVQIETTTSGRADPRRVVRQVERILSLDHDGEEFLRVGERDPVISELQQTHRGQRPVLFHSPYEAAAWAIISARRPSAQAAVVRQAIAEAHGATGFIGGGSRGRRASRQCRRPPPRRPHATPRADAGPSARPGERQAQPGGSGH